MPSMLIDHLPILAMLLTLGGLPNDGYVFYHIVENSGDNCYSYEAKMFTLDV